MKRLFTLSTIIFLLVCMSAIAQESKPLEGIKIYLNPGHGGFDSNDRSIWTIPVPAVWTDSAGYWESKSNFVKGLALRKMLQEAGATVYFSRERNDSGARDLDEFKRKHPNATQAEIDSVTIGGDRDLSAIAEEANARGVDHFLSIHSNALNSKTNYLLMLYHGENGKPTVEHSDQMAAMAGSVQITNQLTTWTTAVPLIRGDITFYGDSPNDPLAGLGVLRPLTVPGHLSEGSFHDYPPETHRLMNGNYCKLEALRMYQYFHKWFGRQLPGTATISGYVKSANERVDVLNQPKFYYIPNSEDQWLPINGATVTLLDESGENVLQTLVTDDWYNGVFAFYDLEPGNYKIRAEKQFYATRTVDVTVAANEISATKIQITNTHTEATDYPEPAQDAGAVALDEYLMEADGGVGENKLPFSRIMYRKGYFYGLLNSVIIRMHADSLYSDGSAVIIANTEEGTITDFNFSADNFLLVLCDNHTVYAYDVNDRNPVAICSNEDFGRTFAVSGPLWKAVIYAANKGGDGIVGLKYSDAQTDNFETRSFIPDLEGLRINETRPVIMPNGSLYLDSPDMFATEAVINWETGGMTLVGLRADNFTEQKVAYGGNFFRYAKHSYMALPVCNEASRNTGFCLIDITKGFSEAQLVSPKYPKEGLGTDTTLYMTALPVVEGYEIRVYLAAIGEGMQLWRTVNKPVAAVYAGEVVVTDDNISFRLNEDATSVTVNIESEGEIIDTYDCGALAKGPHSIENPFSAKQYDALSITATARPIAFPQKFSTDEVKFHFYSPRGVCIDKTPSSPFFGRIYVSETVGGPTTVGDGEQRTTTDGIYVLSADFADITQQGNMAWNGSVKWGETTSTNYQLGVGRAAVAENGEVFITSSSFSSSNVYIMNPAKPDTAFIPVFDGKRNAVTGKITKGLNEILNPPMHCVVKGKDADRVLYVMERNNSLGSSCYTNILQFNIGEKELPWNTAPTAKLFDDMSNGSHFQNGNGQLFSDNRGGWWMSQYRYDSSDAVPPFMHINAQGKADFNMGAKIPGCRWGGFAVTADGERLAVVLSTGTTRVFDITYDDAGVPSLTQMYDIFWGGATDVSWSMDFDAAGNLYIVSNTNERLMAYSLPKANNSFTTRISLKKDEPVVIDGVENLTNSEQQRNRNVGIWSVAGQYLGTDEANLPQGVYIVNGNKVVK